MIDYVMTAPATVELTVGGKITKEEMDRLWARLEADLPKEGKLKILEIIDPLDGIEPMAMWEDLKRGLPMIHRFSHAAVVADQHWTMAITKIVPMMTAVRVATCPRDQIEAARAWLAGA